MGDFGIVVVPRDGADTEKIMNHSSILRKFKVRGSLSQSLAVSPVKSFFFWFTFVIVFTFPSHLVVMMVSGVQCLLFLSE